MNSTHSLWRRTIIFISGLGLVYLGLKVIITGGLYVKGIYSNYGDFNIPVGIIFMMFGVVFIIFSLLKRKKENK